MNEVINKTFEYKGNLFVVKESYNEKKYIVNKVGTSIRLLMFKQDVRLLVESYERKNREEEERNEESNKYTKLLTKTISPLKDIITGKSSNLVINELSSEEAKFLLQWIKTGVDNENNKTEIEQILL